MIQHLIGRRETVHTPCTVDILRNGAFMHAHVELDGVEIGPGDSVQVHDAPHEIGFGEHIVVRRMATVTRATALDRLLTKISAYFELTELYEVGFSPGRASA